MIQAVDIRHNFGSLEVLRGVSLNISRGEVVAITGASGAGKTTLLQILGSLLSSDEGEVVIDGVGLKGLSDVELSHLRNDKIGFVFQFHNLLEEFSAVENVLLPAYIGGHDRHKAQQRAEELLTLMGLSERMGHFPSELSGGEQQRVAIARALINSPAVIFADEPSGNLDSKSREEIHHLLFELRERMGLTVVVVTHDDDLAHMSDRRIVMRDGVIVE